MSDEVSLELQQELFELTDWIPAGYDPKVYGRAAPPPYSLGWILRMLPERRIKVRNFAGESVGWSAQYNLPGGRGREINCEAETPENAVAKLCIALIKEGVITL